jgi:hypothetical protein
MADFTPVALGIQKQEGMSLGDMLNIARGAQAYRQAEQVNPLALEQAQETTKQQKLKTETDTMGLQQKRFKHIADSQISMINNPLVIAAEQNPKAVDPAKLADLVKRNGMTTAKALGIPQDQAEGFLAPYIDLATTNPAALRQYYKERHIQGLDEGSRTTALTPSGIAVDYGTGGQVTSSNPFSAVPSGQAIPGTQFQKGLAPQTFTTETGAPGVIGGTGGGIVNQPNIPPVNRSVAPNAPGAKQPSGPAANVSSPAATPAAPTAENLKTAFGAKGGLQRNPDETYEAYRARVADLAAKPKQANQSLSLANQDSIPNQEYNNNKVLKLLESKNIRVGKLAEAIASKTGGIGLNSEEQEIQKYLEQRIRQNSLRSNQDENSQKMASGSFGTDINALRDIIYNDKGLLASQRLLNQGILKYQGNPNKPNLSAINEFENKFNLINQDRNVTHLLGIVGERSLDELSKSDVQQLKKVFGGMSKEQIDKLFAKKQQLEDLVHGAK